MDTSVFNFEFEILLEKAHKKEIGKHGVKISKNVLPVCYYYSFIIVVSYS